ncbi:MAG: hypothetical protein ACM3JJ_05390 [Hyphomicrobiales bacterium]
MKTIAVVSSLATLLLLSPVSIARSQGTIRSFAFETAYVEGAAGVELVLSGGGEFDRAWGYVRAGGGFRCMHDIGHGPLAGCRAGEGLRWEATEILPAGGVVTSAASGSGSRGEGLRAVRTDDETVVMRARFYRRGDGSHAAYAATMIVSARDVDPARPGVQNVWVEGVGSGDADLLFEQ